MRVLMLNLSYPPNVIGGAELCLQTLSHELVECGVEVSVVSLSQSTTDWQYDDQGIRAYFVHAHPMGIALLNPNRTWLDKVMWHLLGEFNMWSSKKLTEILDAEQPDILHTHSLLGFSTNVWRVAHYHSVPIVHTLHDYQLLCPRGTMFRRGVSCATQCKSCRRITCRRRQASVLPDAVVGVSHFVLNKHYAHGYFAKAIKTVIPNGLRAQDVPFIRSARTREGPFRIGFIGRLHPTKGVEVLFDALRHLPQGSYSAKVAGTGHADYERRLRLAARDLSVEFMGWVPRDQFYGQIDVLVVPSIYDEPQGMVLLEAANLGIPVIYSNLGGLGEMVGAFPGYFTFNPSKKGNLAAVLLSLLENPERFAAKVEPIRRVSESFTVGRFAAHYNRLYEQVLKRRASAYRAALPISSYTPLNSFSDNV